MTTNMFTYANFNFSIASDLFTLLKILDVSKGFVNLVGLRTNYKLQYIPFKNFA